MLSVSRMRALEDALVGPLVWSSCGRDGRAGGEDKKEEKKKESVRTQLVFCAKRPISLRYLWAAVPGVPFPF